VGKFEVTFDEWDACVDDGGYDYRPKDQGWGRGKRPVINVSWNDAQAYLAWLSRKTGKTYRLLTEAEWEYVARAGTTTPFWWGSSISPSQANYHGAYHGPTQYGADSKGEFRGKTVPVDSFAPNPWGLYNVHGNVAEWVQDCYRDYKGAPSDGSAREVVGCTRRVNRGGTWTGVPGVLRSAVRSGSAPETRSGESASIGFRVARTL
jgi:formylglycine-generating enzyme required for sulfatase activity